MTEYFPHWGEIGNGCAYRIHAGRWIALEPIITYRFGSWLPIAFMHERHSPSHHRRLVVVQIFGDRYALLFMRAAAFDPGAIFAPPKRLRGVVGVVQAPSGPTPRQAQVAMDFKVFAGQPDPKDESRFTIDYEIDGKRHFIDGRLQDDDSIQFVGQTSYLYPEK